MSVILCVKMCVVILYRVKKKIVTWGVTKIGGWLQLERYAQLHDSIKTLVLYNATKSNPYTIGKRVVNINLRHPVYASFWATKK